MWGRRSVREWLVAAVIVATGCGRSGIELAERGETAGTSSGATPAGSGGTGAGTAGAAGRGEVPFPNCRVDTPLVVPVRQRRWYAFEAWETSTGRTGPLWLYIVELTPNGPENPTRVGDLTQEIYFKGFSADGRFLAYTGDSTTPPAMVAVFEVSLDGSLTPVDVPQRQGSLIWSPSGARYFLRASHELLTIVDVTTGTETLVTVPTGLHLGKWLRDGHTILLWGDSLALVDTLAATPGVEYLYRDYVHEVQLGFFEDAYFPDNGRYVVFRSFDRLFVLDTLTKSVDAVSTREEPQFIQWFRNDWLAWSNLTERFFLDVSRMPHVPISFGDGYPRTPSPGGKCVWHYGYQTSGEEGLFVQSLPPHPERPSVLVATEPNRDMHWARTGDHLALRRYDPVIVDIELAGGGLEPELVTQGIDTDDVGLARWNPNGRSDWFHYVASSGSRDDMQPRLWHRETRQTFTLDVPNTTAEAPDISPDGKYLVVRALTPERNGYALHVQEVLDGELGGRWMIEGLRAPLERSGPQQRWQP